MKAAFLLSILLLGLLVSATYAAKDTGITIQKSANGPIAISECSPDGYYVEISNAGRRERYLSGWIIKRTIDNKYVVDFSFPEDFSIKGRKTIKIFANGHVDPNAGPNDIESSFSSWGTGYNIITELINPNNEVMATHIQKTN